MVTDSDLLALFEPGKQYSRAQILAASALPDLKTVSQRLGKLRSKNKVVQSATGWWSLPGTPQIKQEPADKAIIAVTSPPNEEAEPENDQEANDLSEHDLQMECDRPLPELNIDDADDLNMDEASAIGIQSTDSPEYKFQFLPVDIDAALTKLEISLSPPSFIPPVSDAETKRQVLMRLGDLLDPSITAVLMSILADQQLLQELIEERM